MVVMVKNKVARFFMDHGVYIIFIHQIWQQYNKQITSTTLRKKKRKKN